MPSFWNDLKKPFTILAPMDWVTDPAFRKIMVETGRPDVFFTEFTNCDGLMSAGRDRLIDRLWFDGDQQPIVAQIWGTVPNTYRETAKLLKELGFSGIDINMGCPVRDVTNIGACSALIKNHKLAKEIIQATKEGAGGLPVSVKTRIGFSDVQIEEWLGFLLQQDLAVLSVHLRTAKELSKVPAHWEYMPQIVRLRDKIAPQTLLVGNGDLKSMGEIEEKFKQYGCDGFMVGTGIFSNPWLFNKDITNDEMTVEKRLQLFLKHISYFKELWGDSKNPAILKKFCKIYIQNFPDASSLREKIMACETLDEMEQVVSF
jgi:tRNA-dihydrouridine synthase